MRKAVLIENITLALMLLLAATVAFAQETSIFLARDGGGGWLGVSISDLSKSKVTELKLPDENGVLIVRVEKESPAEKAGLQPNDIIVQFNGIKILATNQFTHMVQELLPDRTTSLVVLRGGAHKTFTVTLGSRPHKSALTVPGGEGDRPLPLDLDKLRQNLDTMKENIRTWDWEFPGGPLEMILEPSQGRMGVNLESMTPQLGDYFGVKDGHGALVVSIQKDSPAEKAGLKAGDVIVGMDSKDITSPGDVARAVRAKDEGDVDIRVLRERQSKAFKVHLEKRPTEPKVFRQRIMAAPKAQSSSVPVV
jgi:serine protease Do